jgi:hypothetical protein
VLTVDLQIRFLRALDVAQGLLDVRDVEPRHALQLAAREHGVDQGHLTLLFLQKLVGCARARATLAAMAAGDDAA